MFATLTQGAIDCLILAAMIPLAGLFYWLLIRAQR